MSIEPYTERGDQDAKVLEFPTGKTYDTSFEHELDPLPAAGPPVPVDYVEKDPDRRPVIPPNLQTWTGIKRTAARQAEWAGYHTKFHAARLPFYYVPLAAFWSIVGVFKLLGRAIRWWLGVDGGFTLMQNAATDDDPVMWLKLEKPVTSKRISRAIMLGLALIPLIAAIVAWWHLPLYAQVLVTVAAVCTLAHYGRPADRPIIGSAMVKPRFRRLTADIVLRAYYRAGLGNPEKEGEEVTFGSKMSRDRYDMGSQVVVNMPYGLPFSKVMLSIEKLASGLDVSEAQVYLTKDRDSNRSHLLYVADVDPLRIPAGRSPLLACKATDIWKPMPLGKDVRNQVVRIPMIEQNFLIGAQPGQGKTFTARTLALYAALDPYVRLSVFDGKGSSDWRRFTSVAHTYGFGVDLVQPDGSIPVQTLLATLRSANKELQQRYHLLSVIEAKDSRAVPEGKITRELARTDPRLRIWVIVIDEFQEYLNTGDPQVDLEIANLLVSIVKKGRAVGIILIDSTQKPTELGSSPKVQSRFKDFRDQHTVRFSLRTAARHVSEAVLGTAALGEGYDSSTLPNGPEYKGVGILYGTPTTDGIVRGFFADGDDAKKILDAARLLREKAGTLDGMAVGETVAVQVRDPLADAIDSFLPGETFLSWETLAARLGEQLPDRYAEINARALSQLLTGIGHGIESRSGAEKGRSGERPKGVYRAALDRAMSTRDDPDR